MMAYMCRIVCVFYLIALSVFMSPVVNANQTTQMTQMNLPLFVETVGKLTGNNFILDPNMSGQISVMMPTGIDESELYNFFLAVMEVHGYAPVAVGNSTKIIPIGSIKPIDGVPLTRPHAMANARDTQVIPVDNVAVVKLVATLQPLISNGAYISAAEIANALIISDSQQNIARLKVLIADLDRPNKQQPAYISLQHAKVENVKNVLTNFFASQHPANSPVVLADEASNSLIITADHALLAKAKDLIQQLDIPPPPPAPLVSKAIYLQYSEAERVGGLLKELLVKDVEDNTLNDLKIVADVAMNAIFLQGKEEQITAATKFVAQLDVRQAQVLVEVIIAEISATKAAEIGVQWALAQGDLKALTSFSGTGPSLVELKSNPASIGNGFSVGIGNFTNTGLNVGALIRALAKDANTNIISTPTLLTLDNQEAQIVVGQNVPFITGQYSSSGGNNDAGGGPASAFQTIKRQDVGLQLKIKPKISATGAIKLDIEQEVSSISHQSNQASDIITNKRSLKTQVIADHQDLIILGGLIDDNLQETSEKVPLLGDLPIIGKAFKYSKSALVKRNLMVFLRPTIVMDEAILNNISHSKYEAIRQSQLQAYSNDLLPEAVPSLEILLRKEQQQQQKTTPPSTELPSQQPDW